MSCFGEFFVKGSEGGVKKAVHFWCTAFLRRLWILHGMGFDLLIERTSFESGNYLLIFIGRTGHKLCGLFNIA